MKAHLRNIRISPKKMSVVAKIIRGKRVDDALKFLKFAPKKAANLLYKVVASAAANAENNFKQKKDDLVIKNVLVTQGPTYKRGRPVSRGRWHPIKKRTAHVTVMVETPDAKEVKSIKAKVAKPTAMSTEEAHQKIKEIKEEAKSQEPGAESGNVKVKAEQSEGKINTPTPRKTG